MVQVNITRQSVETLADEGEVQGVTRQDIQVAADFSNAAPVLITRQAIEVLGQEPDVAAVTRQDIQVASDFSEPAQVQITRQAIEVLAGPDAEVAATRQDIQVAADFTSSSGPVLITRQSIECLARQGSAGPVEPLPLMDDAHIFLHNWATKARMRTSFDTSVASSPDSGAESRRGLNVKPFRSLDLEWMVCPGSGLDLDDLERLEVFFRRMGDQRFQMPIYMDQKELAASYGPGESTIFLKTNDARFFTGARVGVVTLDFCNQPTDFDFYTIDSMENDRLNLSTALGMDVPAGSYVFPIMDCEVQLEVSASYQTSRVPRVKVTVAEAPGGSQLPPLKSDDPTGAPLAPDGRPVWFEEPDWSRGITKGRSRQGQSTKGGRADFVVVEGDRSRQTHKFEVTGERAAIWSALEFFETRRGRLRSFWHIDQDQYYETVDIDTASGQFVGVSEIGDIADTQEEFTSVGIVLKDGTHIVRNVSSILQVLTVFRISTTTAFQLGLLPADVARTARARLVRFKNDEFVETWDHTGYCTAGINIIEVLNEEDFSIY